MPSDRDIDIVERLRKVAIACDKSELWLPGAKPTIVEAADLITRLRAAPAEGMVSVPQSALDWLFGEGPDANGLHWGDDAYGDLSKRPYWWRSHFRKLIGAALAATPSPAPACFECETPLIGPLCPKCNPPTAPVGLIAALEEFVRMESSITHDIRTAHSLRGAGASDWMREDDHDMQRDLSAAFEAARRALAARAPRTGEETK